MREGGFRYQCCGGRPAKNVKRFRGTVASGSSRLTRSEVQSFLDAVISLVEPVDIWFLWRPQLRDPGDELVLEAAANGRANAIVTFNQRHFEQTVKARMSAFALRLPASIKAEAERIAREDGTSLNQFVASAVAEKVAAIRTLKYFEPFKARANLDEFDRIMRRESATPPQPGDEMPDD